MSIVSYLWIVSYFCCLFSYPRVALWGQNGQVPWHQGVGKHRGPVGEGDGVPHGLGDVPRRACWMGSGKLHHPIILHEMFQHAAEQGWKEAECMICQGCQCGLLNLDLKVDVPAVQLVGPQTSKEEFRALYYEVYKLWRLPGSPLGELEQIEELTAEIVSSL